MIRTRDLGIWVTCLAMVAVGLRNFEPGLSSDAPLYASIARNIVRSGNWFFLDSSIPSFVPFVEHPHLFFWILASVFEVLPFADWAARIPGHLFYVGFLWTFAWYLQRRVNAKTAVWAVLLLWSWFRFSNFFSNVYLDPGLLFFGFGAFVAWDESLVRFRTSLAALAGVALALAALTKGLAVGGFLPTLVLVALLRAREAPGNLRPMLRLALSLAAALLVVLVLYALAVRASSVPDFLTLYWQKQGAGRIGRAWNWMALWEWPGWAYLRKDTYSLVLLAPAIFTRRESLRRWAVPVCLFSTFAFLYAGSGLAGSQYWLTVLPWVAWMAADGALSRLPFAAGRVAWVTGTLCVILLFVSQYIPLDLRRLPPPLITPAVLAASQLTSHPLVLEVPGKEINFLGASRLAWYTDKRVRYATDLKDFPADGATLVLLHHEAAPALLQAAGYCFVEKREQNALWTRCRSVP